MTDDRDKIWPGQRPEDKTDRTDLSKRYDLVDDRKPEPLNVAPSDDAPAVDPFTGDDED